MARSTLVSLRAREAVLDGWAAGRTGAQLADALGLPAHTVHNIVTTARRQGDARAGLRNPGAARRPEPIAYPSSQAYLAAARARIRQRTAEWERSDLGRRMREIAVPPEGERGD